jgi:hypothetical protein
MSTWLMVQLGKLDHLKGTNRQQNRIWRLLLFFSYSLWGLRCWRCRTITTGTCFGCTIIILFIGEHSSFLVCIWHLFSSYHLVRNGFVILTPGLITNRKVYNADSVFYSIFASKFFHYRQDPLIFLIVFPWN